MKRSNESTPLIRKISERLSSGGEGVYGSEMGGSREALLGGAGMLDETVPDLVSPASLLSPASRAPSNASVNTRRPGADVYHCHAREAPRSVDDGARRTLLIASIICLLFMVAEVVGGLWAGSLAIITDAAHLLTDFASFLISLFSLYVASRPPTQRMSFGWHRAEVVGAFISVLMIWVVTGVLVYVAIERLVNQTYAIDAKIMLITAGIGVLVNLIMGALLYGSGHGHSHGGVSHSHSHAKKGSHSHSQGRNINVRAAFIHVLGDLVQSIGVLIAAIIIYYWPNLAYVDPICTFIFSVLVLITTVAIMRDALNVLMEGSPRGVDFQAVIESLENVSGVRRVHNLRIWALTMNKVIYSVHLAVEAGWEAEEILSEATLVLQHEYGVYESTIQEPVEAIAAGAGDRSGHTAVLCVRAQRTAVLATADRAN